jgi:hypothetical protein
LANLSGKISDSEDCQDKLGLKDFSLPSAPTPRPEEKPLALSESGIVALYLCVMPGEFASGLTAEG